MYEVKGKIVHNFDENKMSYYEEEAWEIVGKIDKAINNKIYESIDDVIAFIKQFELFPMVRTIVHIDMENNFNFSIMYMECFFYCIRATKCKELRV